MNDTIGNEILRLVKEIAEDEKDLVIAEKYNDPKKLKLYSSSIERKMSVLRIICKEEAQAFFFASVYNILYNENNMWRSECNEDELYTTETSY